MIEFLLFCVVVLFFILFVMSGVYDIRTHKQQVRIAQLERELAIAEFERDTDAIRREQFEKECG